jgi:hypothetical protein
MKSEKYVSRTQRGRQDGASFWEGRQSNKQSTQWVNPADAVT